MIPKDQNELSGKVAIVTGGASGIGMATALLLAQYGASVIVADKDEARGNAVAKQVATAVDRSDAALFMKCNVAEVEDAKALVQFAEERFDRLDLLFNNAGITRRRSVVETSVEEWDLVTAVNLRGVFLVSKFAIPLMSKRGGGCIVNTGSGWGLKGGRDAASYCATKGAVVNLTRAMALDHASHGIRVNCVCPGDTATDMLKDEQRQLNADPLAFMQDAANRPLGRVGTPEEIAESVLFLMSNRSSFVTGAVLSVDGGGNAG